VPVAAATFAFLDDLHLEARGSQRTLRHYRAEYGREGSAAVADPELLIVFQRRLPGVGASFGGAYKGLKWRVELADPAAVSLRAAIALTGEPRSFGLSLLQGYVIEPLLALLAPAANHVLLPAAAIAPDRGVILLIGRSRSGKSSLSARAATEGIAVLGDDHVLVGRDGTCRSFPRRLRLYTDLQETAPHAYRNLPGSQRVLLAAFRVLRAVTRGAVAPPLRVPIEALGPVARDTLPLGLVVVIERGDSGRLERSDLDSNALVEVASMVLREQRTALLRVPDPVWAERLDEVQRNEAQLLQTAFAGVRSALRLRVPTAWDARRAVGELADALDTVR
jgi:hypothetical protein